MLQLSLDEFVYECQQIEATNWAFGSARDVTIV